MQVLLELQLPQLGVYEWPRLRLLSCEFDSCPWWFLHVTNHVSSTGRGP